MEKKDIGGSLRNKTERHSCDGGQLDIWGEDAGPTDVMMGWEARLWDMAMTQRKALTNHFETEIRLSVGWREKQGI